MSTARFDTHLSSDGTRTFDPITAWLQLDGTGTVSIRDSEGVSSIVDNGTGNYTVNFAITMSDNDYCAVASMQAGAALPYGVEINAFNTGKWGGESPRAAEIASVVPIAHRWTGAKLESGQALG